jgi:hypothetical protein
VTDEVGHHPSSIASNTHAPIGDLHVPK